MLNNNRRTINEQRITCRTTIKCVQQVYQEGSLP